jgi:hypothetical protein
MAGAGRATKPPPEAKCHPATLATAEPPTLNQENTKINREIFRNALADASGAD